MCISIEYDNPDEYNSTCLVVVGDSSFHLGLSPAVLLHHDVTLNYVIMLATVLIVYYDISNYYIYFVSSNNIVINLCR